MFCNLAWTMAKQARPGCHALLLLFLALLFVMPQAFSQSTTSNGFRIILKFTGPNGANPNSVTLDGAGNLYGTTFYGGDSSCNFLGPGCGTVFKLNLAGTETVLYRFTGANGDGVGPIASLVFDSSGNIYGITEFGGDLSCNAPNGCGTVFRVDPSGNETILHAFTGSPDGELPLGRLAMDADGNLYGTTGVGGMGYGTVYKIDSSGTETVFHSFSGSDGSFPEAGVILDSAGNLYGTTAEGGTGCQNPAGCGVVFKLDSDGNETILHAFTGGADGSSPAAELLRDPMGSFYGTASGGGNLNRCVGFGCGTIFKLDTNGNVTVLYSFSGRADGAYPQAPLVRDPAGNFYSTTSEGGQFNCPMLIGCGTIFRLDPYGTLATLYELHGSDGALPQDIVRDAGGNLYGATPYALTYKGDVFQYRMLPAPQ